MSDLEENLGEWIEQVVRYLHSRLGSQATARDLAHEAAARLLHCHRRGCPPEAPRGWMFRTAHNLAVDEIRRRLPAPLGLEALGLVADPRSLPAAEPQWKLGAAEVSRSELLPLLPEALSQLPAHYRRMLHARYACGFDCETVAERERISLANTKVRLHRARRRLRQLLIEAHRGRSTPFTG